MSEEKAAQIVTQGVSEIRCRGCKTVLDVSDFEAFTKIACPKCGAEKTVPAKLGDYVLLERIGTGGMGAVYRGTDSMLDREVAIKVLLASMGTDQTVVESFNREAKAAAKLNHPNVAQIYTFGHEQGQPYIVMEFIQGKSLKQLMVPDKYLDEAFVMKTGLDVAAGLRAASAIGLMHSDIKPENILFTENMEAKLIDFGLASFANQEAAEGIWGSPYYIAPEKVLQQEVTERADIYSLGGTLYHALCGRPPFSGETAEEVVRKRLKQDPRDLSKRRSDISETVEGIIMRMLKRSPGERYPNYKSLSSDLQSAVDELTQATKRRPGRLSQSARIYSDVVPPKKGTTGRAHSGRRRAVAGSHATGSHRAAPARKGPATRQISRDRGAGHRAGRAGGSAHDASRRAPSKSREGTKGQAPKKGKGLIMAAVAGVVVLVVLVGILASQKGSGGGRQAWGARPGPAQTPAILFSENFGAGKDDKFTVPRGHWMIQKGWYYGMAQKEGEWVLGLVKLGAQLPPQFRMRATARTREAKTSKNAYIIFDYIGPQNFKYAGMQDRADKWVIGVVTDKGDMTAKSVEGTVDTGRDYKLEISIAGSQVRLSADGVEKMAYDFGGGTLSDGQVGVGSKDGHSAFDDIVISP